MYSMSYKSLLISHSWCFYFYMVPLWCDALFLFFFWLGSDRVDVGNGYLTKTTVKAYHSHLHTHTEFCTLCSREDTSSTSECSVLPQWYFPTLCVRRVSCKQTCRTHRYQLRYDSCYKHIQCTYIACKYCNVH